MCINIAHKSIHYYIDFNINEKEEDEEKFSFFGQTYKERWSKKSRNK